MRIAEERPLTAREIDTLAAGITGMSEPLGRLATRSDSQARFVRKLSELIGSERAEEEGARILGAGDFLKAHHVLSEVLGEEHTPQPEAKDMSEEQGIDIVGTEVLKEEPSSLGEAFDKLEGEKTEQFASETMNAKLRSDAAKKPPLRFKGKERLVPVGTGNPRRAGSHGHRSLQIIIDNPGLTVDDYREKGGRLNDLRWDIEHGNCSLLEGKE
jgi:hypothetical protein